jgi:HK97 family phage portal protein
MEERAPFLTRFHAIYACITLIAGDIAKLRCKLVEQDDDGIWTEFYSNAFSPVLAKPNRYQNRFQFFQQWIVSKLLHGNTYALKERDERGVVRRMYILDPCRTRVLSSPDGSIYYSLGRDYLTGQEYETIEVPASEIIHDVMCPLYHPLCGISPISACALAATQGLSIQGNSMKFFANGSRPGGILTAPAHIPDETAERLKRYWEENYTGEKIGKVAVLGDGLKYEAMAVNAVDSQLVDQLKWTAETVCTCFHVPPYMIGIGDMPTYANVEALQIQYYTQCLQSLLEALELCLDEGLGLTNVPGKTYGTEFDLDDLLRMDTPTKIKTAGDGVRGGIIAPNEARKKFDLKPVAGGDTPYLQQQNFSLAALDKRDSQDDPFGAATPPPAPEASDEEKPQTDDGEEDDADPDTAARLFAGLLQRDLKLVLPS